MIEEIARKFQLEISLSQDPEKSDIFVLSNLGRFGHTIPQYIESVYIGLRALIRAELKLSDEKQELLPELPQPKWLADEIARKEEYLLQAQ